MLLLFFFVCLFMNLGISNGESFQIFENLFGFREPTERNPRAIVPQWGTFTVKLDHYNPFDARTFEMRYLKNDQFFQDGGPIFVFLGGEWTISEANLMTGQMFDMASDHNGYMFHTEHRYYGESFPTEDYSTENLKYLTTDQALEDLANFISYQKSFDMFKNSKVVVVGASYSAAMATWLRLKYPHLVDIAYASSSPLLAKADFYEYLEVVNDGINATDPECLNAIETGMQEILEYLQTSSGRQYIAELFSLCDNATDLTNSQEKSYFLANIISAWAGIVQYATAGVIEYYCNVVHETDGDGAEKLAAFLYSYYPGCLANYATMIEFYGSSALTTDFGRQWHYQTCTAYGFYVTTSSEKQPFNKSLPLEFYDQMCLDLYGSDFTPDILDDGINRTNLLYGHLKPDLTKVISVHGTIDPWHTLGLSEDLNELAPTIVVEGACHCLDLQSANPDTDSSELYAAKIRVKQVIGEWLGASGNTGDTGSGLNLQSSLLTLITVFAVVISLK